MCADFFQTFSSMCVWNRPKIQYPEYDMQRSTTLIKNLATQGNIIVITALLCVYFFLRIFPTCAFIRYSRKGELLNEKLKIPQEDVM